MIQDRRQNFIANKSIDLCQSGKLLRCVNEKINADIVVANLHHLFNAVEESFVGFLYDQEVEIARLRNCPASEPKTITSPGA